MSKTVDELIGVYIEASNAVVWEAEKRGLCPMTLDMQRAGIAAVIRALRDDSGRHGYLSWADLDEILGDAGAATADAIQPQGEAQNGFRRSIEGPEGGAASGAFGLERKGDVVGASGAGPEQQDDVAVHLHRVPRGACGVPEGEPGSVAGVADGRAGRGLGDSSLNEKVAGQDTAKPEAIERSTPATDPAPNSLHEAVARARGRPLDPGRDIPMLNRIAAALKSPAPAVCVWRANEYEGAYSPGCETSAVWYSDGSETPQNEGYNFCPSCGKPIKFTEAKT